MKSPPDARLRRTLSHALRLVFRLIPMPPVARDWLRRRFLTRYPGLIPENPRGRVVSAAARRHGPRRLAGGRAVGYRDAMDASLPDPAPATLVAFYLPQFHPIPENDAWWGRGFTEWRNVARALPQYEGHVQPRLPGELGFYDLRVTEVVRQQMDLARRHGIGAFCFYYYWFGGRRLLERPLENWLSDPSLDLPVCLCWANENWSRQWDGSEDDILLAQSHSADDDLAFITHVARYLRDPRYLRVEGRPLLLVYRASLMPDPAATAALWREACRAAGIGEILLACVHGSEELDPRAIGFDAAVEFPPNLTGLPNITANQHLINPDFRGQVLDWRALAANMARRAMPDYTLFPGVNPGWDNEPRRSGRGRICAHASPRGYRDWLEQTVATRAATLPPTRRLVFVNAWNEWAEGALLEPDSRLGHAWLQATREALRRAAGMRRTDSRPCAVVHAWYVDVLDEIVHALRSCGLDWRLLVTVPYERETEVRERLGALGMPHEIVPFANRGRDILPFLHVAGTLLDQGVEVVLKIHTKRSIHRGDGDAWRRELMQELLTEAPAVNAAFATNPSLGLVAAAGHVQPLDYYWGANRENVDYLTRRLGIPAPDVGRDHFVAGSMFWVRLEALRPLLDAHLDEDEFDEERDQLDGTLAHAVERVVALAVRAAGFDLSTTEAIAGGAQTDTPARDYPYAKRSD